MTGEVILWAVVIFSLVAIYYVLQEVRIMTFTLRQEIAGVEERANLHRAQDKKISQFRADPLTVCEYNARRTDKLADALGLEWKVPTPEEAGFVKKAKAK